MASFNKPDDQIKVNLPKVILHDECNLQYLVNHPLQSTHVF
jgi:hypothetical protein